MTFGTLNTHAGDRQECPSQPRRPGAWLRRMEQWRRAVVPWRGVRDVVKGVGRHMLPLLPCLARCARECVYDGDVQMRMRVRLRANLKLAHVEGADAD